MAAPLARGLKVGEADKLLQPAPVLVVGMNGACVKGPFFENLPVAERDTLKETGLLLSRVNMMEVLNASPFQHIALQATLPGSGAFGGDAGSLGPAFAKGIEDVVSQETTKFIAVDPLGTPSWFGTIPVEMQTIIKTVGFGNEEEGTAFGSDWSDTCPHCRVRSRIHGPTWS
jgi:hypothetical protein